MAKILKLGMILAVFCILSAGGLALVYMFTQSKIELNAKLALESARQEVLAGKEGRVSSVSPRGYSGNIGLLVGIDRAGKVIKVKILNQRETPGLGANIIKEKFLGQFQGKTLGDPIEPKKDIDAITGATISSKAVCQGVRQALSGSGEAK